MAAATKIRLPDDAMAYLRTRLGEPLPLSDAELDLMKESSPPEFLAHYASKIWRYYVSNGKSPNVIPAKWANIMD